MLETKHNDSFTYFIENETFLTDSVSSTNNYPGHVHGDDWIVNVV